MGSLHFLTHRDRTQDMLRRKLFTLQERTREKVAFSDPFTCENLIEQRVMPSFFSCDTFLLFGQGTPEGDRGL